MPEFNPMLSRGRLRPAAAAFLFFALPTLARAAAKSPSLVVVLAVDQLKTEYLARFRPYFVADGFNRFLERGAMFPEARHRHAWTFTGPGHASIGTGLDPRDHGLPSNNWYDTVAGRRVYCVEDPAAHWVGVAPDSGKISTLPASPVLISGAFLGDRLKQKFRDARVVGVGIKDRAVVPMAGRKADAAIWFEKGFARFVTSTYYPPRPSLLSINERLPEFFAKRRLWPLSGRIPEKELARITSDPPELSRFKDPLPGTNATFPHPLLDAGSVIESPYGDELALELARHAIEDFHLGRNRSGQPDLLFIGLAALDYYGHRFGPDSREVADGVVRLDGMLEAFFAWLDRRVGRERTLLFLTGDHGVTAMPEVSAEKNGGRVRWGNGRSPAMPLSDAPPERLALEGHLAEKLGYALDLSLPGSLEGAVLRFDDPAFYLNKAVLARRRLPVEKAKEAVRDWALQRPGVLAAYTDTEIGNGLPAGAPYALAVERSFRADRSGDVLVILKPGWIFRGARGTTHGQPRDEDSRVPLAAWGAGVKRGSWEARVSPLSIARTIGALFGFEAGAADAEVLEPVLGREMGRKKTVLE